jgi:hypothetical protein
MPYILDCLHASAILPTMHLDPSKPPCRFNPNLRSGSSRSSSTRSSGHDMTFAKSRSQSTSTVPSPNLRSHHLLPFRSSKIPPTPIDSLITIPRVHNLTRTLHISPSHTSPRGAHVRGGPTSVVLSFFCYANRDSDLETPDDGLRRRGRAS